MRLAAQFIAVKTQRSVDKYGRYIAHLFYSRTKLDLDDCLTDANYLNNELLESTHATHLHMR